ncbi:hypothetical protein QJS66_22830 [Kocuria rhizophila]|nr:hypothetical protein QJS66_22830 [Kocuria rhizophila]
MSAGAGGDRREGRAGGRSTSWRPWRRLVLPADADADTLPLFVDFDAQRRSWVKSLRRAEAGGRSRWRGGGRCRGLGQSAQLAGTAAVAAGGVHVQARAPDLPQEPT